VVRRAQLRHFPNLSRLATIALGVIGLIVLPLLSPGPLANDKPGTDREIASNAPVEVKAESHSVEEHRNIIIFAGNVSVTQGKLNLRADEVRARCEGKITTNANEARTWPGDITQIHATGRIEIANGDLSAMSEWAVFDVPTQEVTVGGEAVVSRWGVTVRADKAVIDLKTGRVSLRNKISYPPTNGRN
jgi:lipopolysaccharide transport protein LptA